MERGAALAATGLQESRLRVLNLTAAQEEMSSFYSLVVRMDDYVQLKSNSFVTPELLAKRSLSR